MTGHQGFRVYALTGSGFSVALCVAAGVVQVTGHFPVPGVMLAGFLLISLGYAFAAWALIENRFFPAWCVFRWIEGMLCVTVVSIGL